MIQTSFTEESMKKGMTNYFATFLLFSEFFTLTRWLLNNVVTGGGRTPKGYVCVVCAIFFTGQIKAKEWQIQKGHFMAIYWQMANLDSQNWLFANILVKIGRISNFCTPYWRTFQKFWDHPVGPSCMIRENLFTKHLVGNWDWKTEGSIPRRGVRICSFLENTGCTKINLYYNVIYKLC